MDIQKSIDFLSSGYAGHIIANANRNNNILEKDFQVRFTRWARHNMPESAVVELKITHTHRMAFSRLEEHQELALLAARGEGFVYKISDIDTLTQKPCDMIIMRHVKAYVAVMFYLQRGDGKRFWLIPIEEWIALRTKKDISGEKSFVEADCDARWLRELT